MHPDVTPPSHGRNIEARDVPSTHGDRDRRAGSSGRGCHPRGPPRVGLLQGHLRAEAARDTGDRAFGGGFPRPGGRLGRAFPGRVVGVGQDPQPALDSFASEYGLTLPLVPDLDPYEASDAYGIVSAPTAVAVADDGTVLEVAESWDRDAWNRLAGEVADALGVPAATVSDSDDGLPDFKPG